MNRMFPVNDLSQFRVLQNEFEEESLLRHIAKDTFFILIVLCTVSHLFKLILHVYLLVKSYLNKSEECDEYPPTWNAGCVFFNSFIEFVICCCGLVAIIYPRYVLIFISIFAFVMFIEMFIEGITLYSEFHSGKILQFTMKR